MSSGELIGRGPRDQDVLGEGGSDILCACIIGVGGCKCGVDGNVRDGVTTRPRSSGVENCWEDESGGGE